MIVSGMLIMSLILQFVPAFFALRLIKITGKYGLEYDGPRHFLHVREACNQRTV